MKAHGTALTPTPASAKTVTWQVSAHNYNYFSQADAFTMYSSENYATVMTALSIKWPIVSHRVRKSMKELKPTTQSSQSYQHQR